MAKRNTSELTVTAAVEKMAAVDVRQNKAMVELLVRFENERADIMQRVHPAARAAVESEREKASVAARQDEPQAASVISYNPDGSASRTPASTPYTASGVQTALTEERLSVARGAR